MRKLFSISSAAVVVWITLCLFAIVHEQTEAAFGDPCTKNDTSNCTKPQLTCFSSLKCGCSQGYVKDTSDINGTFCRLPAYNESCDITVGCQPYLQCLNTSGPWMCQCDQAVYYYNSTLGQCIDKPIYGEHCDVNIGCEVFNECMGTPPICQCNTSTVYFDSTMYQCMLMSDLKVNILSTVVSPTTVTFTWEEQNPDTDVFYRMSWTPKDGHLDYINSNGGQVSGLHHHTLYNFTVTSVLPADPYFPEKSVSESLPPIQTMALQESSFNILGLCLGIGFGGCVFITVVAACFVFCRRRTTGIQEGTELVTADNLLSDSSHDEGNGRQSRKDITSHGNGFANAGSISYGTLPLGSLEGNDIRSVVNDNFDNRDNRQLLAY